MPRGRQERDGAGREERGGLLAGLLVGLLAGLLAACHPATNRDQGPVSDAGSAAPESPERRDGDGEGSAATATALMALSDGDRRKVTVSYRGGSAAQAEEQVSEVVYELGRVDTVVRHEVHGAAVHEQFEERDGVVIRLFEGVWLPLIDDALIADGELHETTIDGWQVARQARPARPDEAREAATARCIRLAWQVARSDEISSDAPEFRGWSMIDAADERWILCEDLGEVARESEYRVRAGPSLHVVRRVSR